MSQNDILDLLEQHPLQKFTVNNLSHIFDLNTSGVCNSIRKLKVWNLVHFELWDGKGVVDASSFRGATRVWHK